MKNELLLKELLKIEKCEELESILSNVNSLIEKVKTEILLEENENNSSKQRLKKCISFHKKMLKSPRPILAYANNRDFENKQAFTDGFFLTVLNSVDQLPIDDFTIQTKFDYPNLKRIYSVENYKQKTFTCNLGKLLNYFKCYENLNLINKKTNFSVCLNKETFENFIVFLNLKKSENITLYAVEYDSYENSSIKPVYCKTKNDSEGVILPLKFNEEYHQINEEEI